MATGEGSQTSIDPLRLLFLQLGKDLDGNEVTEMKELLLHTQIPKNEFDKLNTAPKLFRCLEEKGHISSTNLDLLNELMDAIGRSPLKKKISSYLQKVSGPSAYASQTQTGKEEVQQAVKPGHSTTTNEGFFKSFGDILGGVVGAIQNKFIRVSNSTDDDVYVNVQGNGSTGYSLLESRATKTISVPGDTATCTVTAKDEDGGIIDTREFKTCFGTYSNAIITENKIRKGFKNKNFRVCEDSQEYYGPFVCPGCRQKKCRYPRIDRNDGWCEKE